MPLEVRPFTAEDARRAFEIEHLAFANNRFTPVLFPGPFPEDAADARAKAFAEKLGKDPAEHILKVVDTDLEGDEQMIAWARWHVYPARPELEPHEFGPGCNIEACEKLFGYFHSRRPELTGDRPYVYLRLLQTDPKHQRRGAGAMLVRWGQDEAQRLGLMAALGSSEEGHDLYLKMGFQDVELQEVDLSKWGPKEKHRTWFMKWEPIAN